MSVSFRKPVGRKARVMEDLILAKKHASWKGFAEKKIFDEGKPSNPHAEEVSQNNAQFQGNCEAQMRK